MNTKRRPLTKTPCTPDDLRAIEAISPSRVTYCPGIGTKRFAREIQGAKELTQSQRDYVWQIVYRFRRQIADRALVKLAHSRTPLPAEGKGARP